MAFALLYTLDIAFDVHRGQVLLDDAVDEFRLTVSVETGDSKAMLIDFNYDVEPLMGTFPIAGIGPFSLLKETRANHLGKLLFRWIYWNGLLPAKPIPLGHDMTMSGKRRPDPVERDNNAAA